MRSQCSVRKGSNGLAAAHRTMMFGFGLALFAAGAAAQSVSSPQQVTVPLTLPKGVPLRITLQDRVAIDHAGERLRGRLAAPVYVYDRAVLPAGCEVLGRLTSVQNASRLRRTRAIMNGNFSPLRTATVEFDTLILKNGDRVPISTVVQPGAAPTIELVSGGSEKKSRLKSQASGVIAGERQQFTAEKNAMLDEIRQPGKMHRLEAKAKQFVVAESPYHHQAFQAGTVFTATLQKPLDFGVATLPAPEIAQVGSALPADCTIRARLVTPLDSATAHPGTPVEAVVTEPLFSPKHQLIVPQGTRLEGSVVRAKAARWLHRDGSLRFTFQRIKVPAARPKMIHASVARVEVASASHLKLDSEGGVAPAPSKKKYIAPAVSVALALVASAPREDVDTYNGVTTTTTQAQGGALGQVLSGGWGLGLAGSAIALAAQSRVLTATLGFYGAALSIYSNLLARGHNVAFPPNTPMEIELGAHQRPAQKSPLPALHLPGIPRG